MNERAVCLGLIVCALLFFFFFSDCFYSYAKK